MHNPYDQEITRVTQRVATFQTELSQWEQQLVQHKSLDIAQLHACLETVQARLPIIRSKLEQAKRAATESQAVEVNTSVFKRAAAVFSNAAKEDLLIAQKLLQKQADDQSTLASLEHEHAQASLQIEQAHNTLAQAKAFDVLMAEGAIASITLAIKLQKDRITDLHHKSQQWSSRMAPTLQEFESLQTQRQTTQQMLEQAQSLHTKLTLAANSWERREVHQKCEQLFGEGSPAAIERRCQQQLRTMDHHLQKIQKRMNDLTALMEMDVRHLIFDGNNLCYEHNRQSDQTFIGLRALSALISALQTYRLTIIFDGSILRKLSTNRDALAAAFPGVTVHVVNVGTSADETILHIAQDDPSSVVISNDTFKDFGELQALRANRVLKHEITAGLVRIHALDISAKYSTEAKASI